MDREQWTGDRKITKTARAFLAAALLLVCAASARAESENDFYRALLAKPLAVQEDLVRAVARFKGYRGPSDLRSELEYLYDMDILFPRNIVALRDRPVTKGEATRVLLNAMGDSATRRGLLGRLFRNSKRYAARDGMAQKILPSGSYSGEYVSGSELMAMLGRAVEQMGKK